MNKILKKIKSKTLYISPKRVKYCIYPTKFCDYNQFELSKIHPHAGVNRGVFDENPHGYVKINSTDWDKKHGVMFTKLFEFIALEDHYNGKKDPLFLGNLNAKRDWGSAEDYVKSMWLMMQKKKPSDYVIATGVSKSVRNFVEEAYKCIGIKISWKGKGINEVGINTKTKQILIKIDKYYLRPTEVFNLRGDYSKAKKELGWKPTVSFKKLVKEMVDSDIKKSLLNKEEFSEE